MWNIKFEIILECFCAMDMTFGNLLIDGNPLSVFPPLGFFMCLEAQLSKECRWHPLSSSGGLYPLLEFGPESNEKA